MDTSFDYTSILYRVKFVLILIFQILSLSICILIFWFFNKHRPLLHDLRHQALLFLLIINFIQLLIDLPMPLNFYYIGYVSPAVPAYCTWWTFFEYTLDVACGLLVGVISIQRHLLIFHERILHVLYKRIILYYIPLLLCIVYPFTLYLIIIVFYPCDGTQWDYTSNVCGFANCHLVYNKTLATFDWIAQNGMPTVIIILANISIVLRVIKQKRRHGQPITWKKQRRITLQLLSISTLYLIAWLPSLIVALVQQFIDPDFLVQIQKDFLLDLVYLTCLFLPWVIIGQLPRFTQWIQRQLCHRENRFINTVQPA